MLLAVYSLGTIQEIVVEGTTPPAPPGASEAVRSARIISEAFVLVDELDAPWKADQLRRAIYQLMATAQVRKVRPYDARHACLTYLANLRRPRRHRQRLGRPRRPQLHQAVYVHPNADHLKAAATQLDQLLG